MRKLVALTVILTAVLFSGCVREEIGGKKMAFGTHEKKTYKPVSGQGLKLEMTGNGQLFAGEGGVITFVLINDGKKKVVIDEWYANEADNVVVSCQNWLPGMTGVDQNAWVKFSFEPRKPAWRYPLNLAPGNRIFITKKLPFVDKLSITPGSERRYFVKGALTLTSVRLESRVNTVSVRNPADKRVKKTQKEQSRHFGR